MTILQALILGIIQGLTEFFPVSSSGHLVLFQHLFGLQQGMLAFDVALHWGSLLAVFIYFYRDLWLLTRDFFLGSADLLRKKGWRETCARHIYFKWALGIIAATIPTGIIGLAFHDAFESMFDSLSSLAVSFWISALILLAVQKIKTQEKEVNALSWWVFVLIGVAQGISVIPAISRSGMTLAAALLLGMKRDEAFRFIFLMSVPVIVAAGLLELNPGEVHWASEGWYYFIGMAASFVFGLISLFFLSKIVNRRNFVGFCWYLAAIGLLSWILTVFPH